MKKSFFILILISLLALPLFLPFLQPGYFQTDDGEWAIVRLGAMHRASMIGHFPARWSGNLNFGYGYPLFLFTYPLPFYLGEIFNLLGFGLVGSIKLLFGLSIIFSGLAMFFLAREIFGVIGGITAAVFYLYAPFRIIDLYIRGSLGESLAFVLYPLLFLSLLKIKRGSRTWLAFGALLYAGLILTHNVSALLMTPFLIIFAILFVQSRQRRGWLVFVLGLGLASFFLYPALAEKNKIILSQIALADKNKHFLNQTTFSFHFGWTYVLGLVLTILFWFKNKHKILSFFLFSFLASVLLMLPISWLFWKLPLFSEVDFPWRFLGPASFFLCLSLGYLGKKKRFWPLALILGVLTIFISFRNIKPQKRINYPDGYYLTNEATTTSADELMPIWVKEKPSQRANERAEIISGQAEIKNVAFDNSQIAFDLEVQKESVVQLNTIYFPGWQVEVDGKATTIDYQSPRGLMTFVVSNGQHQVLAKFRETKSWLLADAISVMSLLGVGGLLIKKKKK